MVTKIVEYFRNRLISKTEDEQTRSPQRALIATCLLMLEMAYADNEFSNAEEAQILGLLIEQFDLSMEAAKAIISLSESERKRSLDLWQFTNLINKNFSYEEKIHVIEILWQIIYVDGHLEMHEEYLIRKLSNLLNMKHKDLIQAKLNARQTYIKTEKKE